MSLAEALFTGLAHDGGLYMPTELGDLRGPPESVRGLADTARWVGPRLLPGIDVALLERVAVNAMDYDTPDNAGYRARGEPCVAGGPAAYFATLPVAAIVAALVAEGIPAYGSNTAGTYLCNKALYRFLAALEQRDRAAPCGFVHLPYLPEQVADMIAEMQAARSVERQRRPEIPSMSLELMVEAVRLALEVTLLPDAAP